jgi:hypothetical protein
MKSYIYIFASLASSKCVGPNIQKPCNMSVFSKTIHVTACFCGSKHPKKTCNMSVFSKTIHVTACFCGSKHPKNMQYECVFKKKKHAFMGPNIQKTCNMSVFSKTIHVIACFHFILFRDTISDLYHSICIGILHLSLAARPSTFEK